jgi:signal transduction histidine kinase
MKIENFFKNKSINHIHKISLIFITLFTALFTTILLYNMYLEHKIEIKQIENNYIDKQKQFIKDETLRALRYIKYKYNKNKNIQSKEELILEIVDVIEQMRNKGDGTGYIFIYNFNGINIADPILKENAGKNLLNFKDINGKKVIKELIEVSKNQNGGYVEYVWNKPIINIMAPKISYAISFNELNWMIGTGVYLDNINDVLVKKKEYYNSKVKRFIIQILIFSAIIFFISIIVYRYFTSIIQEDLNLIQNSLVDLNKINTHNLYFLEFRFISKYINGMRNELQDLNKNLENKVIQRTENLRKSEEFAKDLVKKQNQFITTSIHEINTPLSIIITNIDLFKLKFGENRYLSKIEAGSKVIHNTYNDLSYTIKKDRIEYPKALLSFSIILKERVEFFDQVAIGNSVNIILTNENEINILFNEIELQRMIDNSISNAIKYSYQNTNILIELSKTDTNIIFQITNYGDTIINIDKLFSKYYRENEYRGGFGLGLSIIENICTNNNIKIDVQSKDNKSIFKYIWG